MRYTIFDYILLEIKDVGKPLGIPHKKLFPHLSSHGIGVVKLHSGVRTNIILVLALAKQVGKIIFLEFQQTDSLRKIGEWHREIIE